MEKKILIVDDSEMNLFLLQSIFYGDDTIQTILESDSTKVLGHLRENIPDLILLDLVITSYSIHYTKLYEHAGIITFLCA